MSFNPDESDPRSDAENLTELEIIESLRQENSSLKLQIEELSRRLAGYEIEGGSAGPALAGDGRAPAASRSSSSMRANNRSTSSGAAGSRGRKSIPFEERSDKQHQGRMAYLLKLLEKQSEQTWNQDLIADLQEYCVSDAEFFREALLSYCVNVDQHNDFDIDTFIAMLQSH